VAHRPPRADPQRARGPATTADPASSTAASSTTTSSTARTEPPRPRPGVSVDDPLLNLAMAAVGLVQNEAAGAGVVVTAPGVRGPHRDGTLLGERGTSRWIADTRLVDADELPAYRGGRKDMIRVSVTGAAALRTLGGTTSRPADTGGIRATGRRADRDGQHGTARHPPSPAPAPSTPAAADPGCRRPSRWCGSSGRWVGAGSAASPATITPTREAATAPARAPLPPHSRYGGQRERSRVPRPKHPPRRRTAPRRYPWRELRELRARLPHPPPRP
jgi:hypothetical protein